MEVAKIPTALLSVLLFLLFLLLFLLLLLMLGTPEVSCEQNRSSITLCRRRDSAGNDVDELRPGSSPRWRRSKALAWNS
jgi:hypothetical protein